MTKMTPSISICFVPSDLYKIQENLLEDIETLYEFQQDARAWAGNLIYGVRLHMNVGDRLAETFF